MKRGAVVAFGVVLACRQDAPPPTVPVPAEAEINVPPMPKASSAPIVQEPAPVANEPEPEPEDPYSGGLGSSKSPPKSPSPLTPTPAPNPTGARGAPFDKGGAASALGAASVRKCAGQGGPTGAGHVTITFGNNGKVVTVVVDQGPFPGTPTGACIAGVYRSVHVPAFAGPPVRVGKSFVLQ